MSHRLRMMAGGAALVAGALVILMELGYTADTLLNPDAAYSAVADTPLVLGASVLGLLGVAIAIPAIMGIYRQQAEDAGTFGLVAAGVLCFALLLVAGVQWLSVFVAPWLAEAAPEVLDGDPGGTLAIGFIGSFAIHAVGAVLFGVSTLRAGTYARWPAIAMILGGVSGVLPLDLTFTGLFAGAAMMGYGLQLRHQLAEQSVPAHAMPGSPAAPAV